MAPGGLLNDLGAEINAIIYPVTICMFLVVFMVRGLTPSGSSDAGPALGTLIYQEQSTDTTIEKIEGAFLNAAVFIVAIAVMTFVLFAMFYFRCTRVIWAYMGFSGLVILTWLGGSVAVQTIQAYSIPFDIISFSLYLYNFSVVGVLAVFFCRMPIFLTQSYLVVIGAVVAFWFTHLPEWTTWLLLVAMSLYDLFAVLTPGGPLKLLVELAIERNEEIPALVYEGRPTSLSRPSSTSVILNSDSSTLTAQTNTSSPSSSRREGSRARRVRPRWQRTTAPHRLVPMDDSNNTEQDPSSISIPLQESSVSEANPTLKALSENELACGIGEIANSESDVTNRAKLSSADVSNVDHLTVESFRKNIDEFLPEIPSPHNQKAIMEGEDESSDDESRPLVNATKATGLVHANRIGSENALNEPQTEPVIIKVFETGMEQTTSSSSRQLRSPDSDARRYNLTNNRNRNRNYQRMDTETNGEEDAEADEDSEDDEFVLPDAIKLGLGDFIFYSVLVGRAAMYDLMTVYSCYLAIIAGLGMTLILLAIYKKALPALPISIALGIVFYLLTRLFMDPFVVNLTIHLIFI